MCYGYIVRYISGRMAGLTERCVGAVVGSLVADASAMPVHWIYDKATMKDIMEECHQKPEFLPKSRCPFYSLPTGHFSCYGDQTFVLLKSIVERKDLNIDHYKKMLFEKFGPESAYEVDLGHPITKDDRPISGPWRHASLRDFIKNYSAGESKTGKSSDSQADGLAKVAPLVALYAGDTDRMLAEVETVIRVTQEDNTAVECGQAAASILEKCVLGKSIETAIQETQKSCSETVKGYIQQALEESDKTHIEFVHKIGSSCSVPGNFINAVHCLLKSNGDFSDMVTMTIAPGGCNCSRCCFVGAVLGAVSGLVGIPKDWISKTSNGTDIVNYANQLVGFRN